MKITAIIPLLAMLLAVSCTTAVRDTGSRTIFTNDILEIRGKSVGIKDLYRNVYLASFSDYVGNFDLQKDFQTSLGENLNRYGIVLVKNLKAAQAVVSGSIDSLVISTAERATNASGLIYSLKLTFSVNDSEKKYIQMNKPVLEQILVLDTNTYESNDVIPVLVRNAGQHTAEAVYHGWQLEYSKTPDKITTLGVSRETNSGTNR